MTSDFEDGNALAGALSEIFTVDVTAAKVRCVSCGHMCAVANLHVYGPQPGSVARCPDCEAVLMRIVLTEHEAWLDVRGTTYLRVPLPTG